MVNISISGVSDSDGDPITVTPTGVFQDEKAISPGTGSGKTAPDATLTPLAIRAERDGTGDDRLYTIEFTASDGRGGTCTGAVKVCVPHDQGLQCVDDGSLSNALE
jgi:Big-like domain-containing protein